MTLSKESIDALSDLIENRLSIMHIGDRDDLRERIALEHALTELRGPDEDRERLLKRIGTIPHRGRHRKVSVLIGEDERIGERA
jgi:hypothetical protein